jgi:hypothetical protein
MTSAADRIALFALGIISSKQLAEEIMGHKDQQNPSLFYCPHGYGECENAGGCVYPYRCSRGANS